ncbi:hypothetical protein [Sulfurirhabdus autotrophica]|uniref:Uncharacterized protein n=1 Tax=Sulfurirhabdus autotrophica TaxID=1706046 RepID=A0A4R3YDS6_9PROT|nr:hypothetical protein [Sulfurirhabdus autotrophica]TCV90287.1 hypothetical protein EDC63_101257 [Sulfurirhabdus autotrophica]
MAIPWLIVLKSVPWTDVISNAPKIADGAKKLWGAIGKKPPISEMDTSNESPVLTPEAHELILLKKQLKVIESATADLHDQMLASTELIKALAEQNAQLIKRIEENRIRILWLASIVVAFGIMTVINLVLTLR